MTKKHKVKIRLRGGLGNQLFQISAAANLANSCKIALKIFTRDIEESTNKSRGNFLRELDLDKIFIRPGLESSLSSENYIANRLHHRLDRLFSRNVIDTNEKLSEAIASQIPDFYNLQGFFQHIKFVESIIQHNPSVSLLSLRPEVADISRLVESAKTITLHIRLGDFLDNQLDILTSDFFLSAITEFRSQLSITDSKIVVFSDDIAGAHLMLRGMKDICFPEKDFALTPPELLYILSRAKNIVISKSTIAWWGGYIGFLNGSKILSPWPSKFNIF